MASSWYIESWHPLGGLAFLSAREAEDGGARPAVRALWHVSPPYFDPEPVGDLATALGATRGPFQEGFFDADGTEVAFTSLEQAIEAVRRAYRAGGATLGPFGGGVPAAGAGTPQGAGGGGGEAMRGAAPAEGEAEPDPEDLVGSYTRVYFGDELFTDRLDGARVHGQSSLWLANLLELVWRDLGRKACGGLLVESLEAMAEGRGSRRTEAMLHRLLALLARIGVRVDLDGVADGRVRVLVSDRQALEWSRPALRRLAPAFVQGLTNVGAFADLLAVSGAARPTPSLLTEILFSTPLPPRWRHPAPDRASAYPPIPTLGHLVCVATADRAFLAGIESPVQLAPLFLAALLQAEATMPAPTSSPSRRADGSDLAWEQLRDRAAGWLAASLPDDSLAGHESERAITALVRRLLAGPGAEGGPHAPRGGSPAGRPGGEEQEEQEERRTVPGAVGA